MPSGLDFVAAAMRYDGTAYVYGAEADVEPGFQPVRALDCSELVQVALADIAVSFPDGTYAQQPACFTISVDAACATPGALLFTAGPDHVAISRGDGTTIEARGKAYGTGVFPSRNRGFVRGGLIPALAYAAEPPEPLEDDMTGPEFAAAIGAKWDVERGLVLVPVLDHVDAAGQPVFVDAPLASAVSWTHQEAKYLRLGIH